MYCADACRCAHLAWLPAPVSRWLAAACRGWLPVLVRSPPRWAGIADALATITPALLTPGRGGPPPAVLRAALYGHAFNPARAAATAITRKRAVFRGCPGYAAELRLLAANPLDRITWQPPGSSFAVDPR
jgi:hypothetical protein